MPEGEYLQYGGQAIVEGVMMRSPHFFSVACRAPNGEVITRTEALEKTWIGRQKWLKLPFLRGSLALVDAMALGIKAMKFASDVQLDPKYEAEGPVVIEREASEAELNGSTAAKEPAKKAANFGDNKKLQDTAVAATMVFSLALAFFIFNYVPNLIAEGSQRLTGTKDWRIINLLAGVIKIGMFLGYVWLIGKLEGVADVFRYHGAEHKAINTLEAHQELNLENCRAQTRLHPRCGTSFAIVVLIVSLVLFTFVPRYPVTGQPGNAWIDVTVRFGIELLILPLIAGMSYELIRLAGKFRNQSFVNVMFKPGLWTQLLTTKEPNEGQIEVALIALQAVVDAEKNGLPTVEDRPEDALESSPMPVP
jgi:uncharacterized protein YqhQ